MPLAAACVMRAVCRLVLVLLLLAFAAGSAWPHDASSYGGVFRSRNFGGTWLRADVGLFLNVPLIVAVDPRNPSHLLAGTDLGLIVSNNGGLTWLPKRRPRRGKENRDAGRSLRTARGAARLHRPVVLTASVHLSLNCPSTLVQGTVLAFTAGGYRDVLTDLPDMRDGFVTRWPDRELELQAEFCPSRLPARSYQSLAGAGSLAAWRRPCSCAAGSAVAPIGTPASQRGCDAHHAARNISWC